MAENLERRLFLHSSDGEIWPEVTISGQDLPVAADLLVDIQDSGPSNRPALAISDDAGLPMDLVADLPDTAVGYASVPAVFTLSNSGQAALDVSDLILEDPSASGFQMVVKDIYRNPVHAASFSIPAGSAYTMEVALLPQSAGSKSATLHFKTNDPNADSITLSLTGSPHLPFVVNIPDAGLEAVLRTTLSRPAGDITDGDMATLNWLWAGWHSISDLTGLSYARNLVGLYWRVTRSQI